MGAKRTAGVQFTPRLLPVSYAAAEVVSSGAPEPITLREGGTVVGAEGQSHICISPTRARKLRPKLTLIFMEANTPQAVAIRDRDIEMLRTAWEENTWWNNILLSRDAILRYLEQERQHYVVACISARGEVWYLSPTFSGKGDVVHRKVPFVVGEIHPDIRFWAFGLPGHITSEDFPDERPAEVVSLDLLADFPWIANTSDSRPGLRALPVVDPHLILRGTAQRYSEACDNYLLHVGEFASRGGSSKTGTHAFYKSRVADALSRLPPNAVSDSGATQALDNAQRFMKRYLGETPQSNKPGEEGLKQFIEHREDAALSLIRWLDSGSLAMIPRLCCERNGKFATEEDEAAYTAHVELRLSALSRLAESERGRSYLAHQLDGLTHMDPAHPAAIISQFVLPLESPSGPTLEIARKVVGGVVGLWLKLFPLILERAAKSADAYVNSGKVFARVNETVQRLTDHIAYLFDGRVLDVLDPVRSQIQVSVQNKLADVFVERVVLAPNRTTLDALTDKARLAGELLEASVEVLNGAIAFASCWEALRDQKHELKHLGDGLQLVKSLIFIADKSASIALKRQMLDSGFKTFLEKVGPRVLVASNALEIAMSGVDVVAAYKKGDYDAAVVLLIASRVAIWGLCASGPVGWSLLGISFGLGLYATALEDDPFDRLAKFSAFGVVSRARSTMEEADLAWTMATSYMDWDPRTRQGLETWLQAAAQLAYGFQVRGFTPSLVDPADGYIQIEARQLLRSSTIHLHVEAEYVNPGPSVVDKQEYKADLWVRGLLDNPELVDDSQTVRMKDAVRVREGRIVEISLRRIAPFLWRSHDGDLLPMVLHNLTCKVRLDVHGDGNPQVGGEDGTLIVPNTKEKKRWVRAEVLKGRAIPKDPSTSVKFEFLS